jgi:catalase
LTLNRNPDNFFAETEQVAFHPGHLVPGIDFTNDPLLHGRLFSYTDTQLIRLGGPNFHEIPINRPLAPLHNLQRDGHMRQTINQGRVSYEPNTLGGGCPMQAGVRMGGFMSYAEKLDGHKVRARSAKFFDHFSQATLFYNSQSEPEKAHMVNALRFELGKVETLAIRERMLYMLAQVDHSLASRVAEGLGIAVPTQLDTPLNMSFPADADVEQYQPRRLIKAVGSSPALSMAHTVKNTIKTRKIAVLAADGFDHAAFVAMQQALRQAGAQTKIVAPRLGQLRGANGAEVPVDCSLLTCASVLFDAVYVPGGEQSVAALVDESDAIHFVNEAYKHGKAIAATGAGVDLLRASHLGATGLVSTDSHGRQVVVEDGVVFSHAAQTDNVAAEFISAIAQHRYWEREVKNHVPA